MTILIKQWKLIIALLALLGSNYYTYQYTDNKWELKWTEASVEALKSTLELQQLELTKQKLLIQEKSKNEQYYIKENEKLNDAFSNLSDEFFMLSKTLDSLSESGADVSTGVDRVSASNSTTRLVQAELQRFTLRRSVELSQAVDKLQLSNELCVREYESVRDIINGK